MKLAIRALLFHIVCIITFALLYLYLSDDFKDGNSNENKKFTILDYFLLSTTIQAGVGITELFPNTFYSKILVIIQQILMLSTHIFTLYIFTL